MPVRRDAGCLAGGTLAIATAWARNLGPYLGLDLAPDLGPGLGPGTEHGPKGPFGEGTPAPEGQQPRPFTPPPMAPTVAARHPTEEDHVFVQVISGRTNQADALRDRFEQWEEDLRPDASGFLGTTGGITADGQVIVIVRFESEEAARRNSNRPEQGEWWAGTAELFQGDPEFADTTDTATWHGGGSDDAGFVQVMRGRVTDVSAAKKLIEEFEDDIRDLRPDVLGSVTAFHDGDRFTQAVYFTNEQEAREREAERGADERGAERMRQFEDLFTDIEYLDLTDPWLR